MVRCTIKEVIRGKVASFVEKKEKNKKRTLLSRNEERERRVRDKDGGAKQKVGGCYALETSNDTDRDVSL